MLVKLKHLSQSHNKADQHIRDMSPPTNLAPDHNNGNLTQDEWVEIVEPKSKRRIYANLKTGLCATKPPEGVKVGLAKDFSDHWWELHDQKSGRNYYYNPDQQKTVWSRPSETSNNGRRLLIIPVSKLQTSGRKSSPNVEQFVQKCDASTQTIASNMVSSGTQTVSSSAIQAELSANLKSFSISKNPVNSDNVHSKTEKARSFFSRRQMSDFGNKETLSNLRDHFRFDRRQRRLPHQMSTPVEPIASSQKSPSVTKNEGAHSNKDELDHHYKSYFGTSSSFKRENALVNIQSPTYHNQPQFGDSKSSISTFGKPLKLQNNPTEPKRIVTNNLSHYLVKEARLMGIALISDDEVDDRDSDDDCEDDEEIDFRDDVSNQHEHSLDASQDFGEDSSEGWKSFSDQESPNSVTKMRHISQKSPLQDDTKSNLFSFQDSSKSTQPKHNLSQQLDHQKLVDNFKKSRQTSSFATQELGRGQKSTASHTSHMIESNINYYSCDNDADRHLRQLSTLSTLPRPHRGTKDKIALSKSQNNSNQNYDADYDIVEENCNYYSDSEYNQKNSSSKTTNDVLVVNKVEPPSPTNHFDRNKSTRGSTFSVESFARENLNRGNKKSGLLFNRKVKWTRMITWTKNSLKRPMISSVSQDLYGEAIGTFKLIQQYMGDRKVTLNKKYRLILSQSNENSKDSLLKGKTKGLSNSSNVCSSNSMDKNVSRLPEPLRDELSYELVLKGCLKITLRDEIFVQLARQLTENPDQESITHGLVLMSILLSYFPPSNKFAPFLLSFLENHGNQMARDVCLPRLEKRLRQSWMTYCRKPTNGQEMSIVRLSITKWPQYCGVFGESLQHIMSIQSCSVYLRTLRLPWILTTLGKKLLETGGLETEGIFRCAADHDLIAQLRLEIDCVDFRKLTDAKQVDSLLTNVKDPHVIAGLLKLFFRQLQEPVFPASIYKICLNSGNNEMAACRVFDEHLSNLNKDVVAYLIQLLQQLTKVHNVTKTKMDSSNLSMVWAPNLLRLPQQEDPVLGDDSKDGSKWSISGALATNDDGNQLQASQSRIFGQTRQEMQFIRALINKLDTSFI